MDFMGESKSLRKIRITWELPDETAIFREEDGPQPFVISKDYTLSLYEKANLRRDLESWRGKQFTADELAGFDIFTLLGAACLISIIHMTKGDKTYANVSGISKLAKGMTCGKQVNPAVQFSIDDGKQSAVFLNLPEWLRKKIADCKEWNEAPHDDAAEDVPFDDDSEIPF